MKLTKITSVLAVAGLLAALPALAGHNGAVVTHETAACGETTFSATVTDPEGTHLVDNMHLVVNADGDTQSELIPVDGSSAEITVGPFYNGGTETISYRVFGGAERDYDDPSWTGYGTPGFSAAVTAYAASVGGFDWVLAGPDDPNPFTTWHELEVDSCEITKELCKNGGWADFGFRNQGQCIRYVNTGQDSRV